MTTFSRVQSADSGHTNAGSVTATFGATPTLGNLLVAAVFHRSEMATAPTFSGSGWTERVWRPTGMGAANDRRGLAIWTKVAGASEPTGVTATWASGGIAARMVLQEIAADTAYSWDFLAAGSGDSGTGATGSDISQMAGTTDSPVGPFAVGDATPGLRPLFRFGYLAGRCYDTNAPGAAFTAASGTVLEAAGAAFQTSWATAFAADATGGTGLAETAAWTNAQLQTSVAALIFGDDAPAPDPDPDPAPDPSEPSADDGACPRRPVTLVELHQRVCALTYGTGACTAAIGVTGTRKCFNTRATCQDRANFELTTKTLRFASPAADLPIGWDAIPSLRSVSVKPSKLNVAGLSKTSGALGLRAAVTIAFQDHPDGDTLTDPYVAERPYDPAKRGTLWGKWLARHTDWQDLELDVLTGWLGQPLETLTRRSFFLEEVAGPDAGGAVRVSGRDILSRADGSKAQAPKRTDGELAFDLTADATECWITADTTFSEYLQQGGLGSLMRIGREIIRFATITAGTDDGNRRFTSLQRGLYGTEAKAHGAGSNAQACLEFVDVSPVQLLETFLTDFADVPPDWQPIDEWEAEAERWLLPYEQLSAVISEPTGVDTLLGEIAESCMLYLWTDEAARKIRMRAVRPPEEGVLPLTDGANLLAGSMARRVEMEEQISRAEVFFGVVDPTEKVDEPTNYRSVRGRVGEQLGAPRVRRIFSRWLKTDSQATQTGRTLMAAAEKPPIYVTCRVGAKDMQLLGPGSVVELSTRIVQDDTGATDSQLFQVIEATDRGGQEMGLSLRAFGAFAPVSLWMAADANDYADATDEERNRGFFWADAHGNLNGAPSPYLWS